MGESLAIRLDKISKKFALKGVRYYTLRDEWTMLWKKILGRGVNLPRNELWALKEVSFEVEAGECMGIIGANGAGKTTLLKLLANVLVPDGGNFSVSGKVGALIELGAGFHPELTGRENVFLYGSIMGIKLQQIREQFDEIVEFSGLENFLDTPLKHYSSGMYARLGFSVAVFTEPQVLLVDEVLAVGDAAFQTRCLRRLSEMKKKGVGILFISHDLTKVQQVCDRCLWLDHGKVQALGEVSETVGAYLQSSDRQDFGFRQTHESLESFEHQEGVLIEEVLLLNEEGKSSAHFSYGKCLTVRIFFKATQKIESPNFSVSFESLNAQIYTGCVTRWDNCNIQAIEGRGSIDLVLTNLILGAGAYQVNVGIWDPDFMKAYDWKWGACQFKVVSLDKMLGRFVMPHTWRLNISP